MAGKDGPVSFRGGVKIHGKVVGAPSPHGEIRGDTKKFRVDFDRDTFAQLVATKGHDVTWEQAMFCPNRRGLDARDHDFSCTTCDSTGFLYFSPTDVRFLVQGVSLEEQYFGHGRFDASSVHVTAPPECRISYWDRFTLKNGENRFTELIRRNSATLRDRPKYNPLCVLKLSWKDRTDTVVDFVEGTDFTLDQTTGELVWSGASRPDQDTYYSIVYLHRPRYVLTDLLNQHRESPVLAGGGGSDRQYEFPIHGLAKLDFLIRDEAADPSENVDPNPFGATNPEPFKFVE
jgi:hypothetical protein